MKKQKDNKEHIKRLKILESAKKIIRKDGWSKNILAKLNNDKLKSSDITYLFPNGYIDLLNLSLNEINISLEKQIDKINIINFPISKRIKKILMKRLEIINKDKIFYKKTIRHLLLPNNSQTMKNSLYNSVDKMWYLAGDNSTDFSFYTKRITLAIIYTNALFILFNQSYDNVEENIDRNLKRISKIPKLKDRLSFIKDNLPIFLRGFLN
tara:strand:- start:541 stop:1170 length:630 start_codon:yes stop_codon:yes gene_type:complete